MIDVGEAPPPYEQTDVWAVAVPAQRDGGFTTGGIVNRFRYCRHAGFRVGGMATSGWPRELWPTPPSVATCHPDRPVQRGGLCASCVLDLYARA